MSKLSQRYISFSDFLLGEDQGDLYDHNIGEFYYETPDYDYNVQIQGALQPFRDMRKDFYSTFIPYDSWKSVLSELLQPFKGILNIGKMIFNTVGVPVVFLLCIFFICIEPSTFFNFMRINCRRSVSWLLDGFASGIRGITQLLSTPLTYSFKMPLRGILTVRNKNTKPKEKKLSALEGLTIGPNTVISSLLKPEELVIFYTTSKVLLKLDVEETWGKKSKEFSEKPRLQLNQSYKSYCASAFVLRSRIIQAVKNPETSYFEINQLFAEVLSGGYEKLRPLLIDKIDVNFDVRSYRSPSILSSFLHLAANQGDAELTNHLLDKGANIDRVGSGFMYAGEDSAWMKDYGYTPLGIAAANGHVECVEALIAREARIDFTSIADGDTPLHRAARNGHLNCVIALIRANARVDLLNREQYLAVDLAHQNKHSNCVKYITEHIQQNEIRVPVTNSNTCVIL